MAFKRGDIIQHKDGSIYIVRDMYDGYLRIGVVLETDACAATVAQELLTKYHADLCHKIGVVDE